MNRFAQLLIALAALTAPPVGDHGAGKRPTRPNRAPAALNLPGRN